MSEVPKQDDPHKIEKMTGSKEGGTDMPPNNEDGAGEGGEDEGGVVTEGNEEGVHEDQKPAKN
ncbi:hypothetical protein [Sphingomonas abietis]|uniref:Uncharacterized protein n=1 Tax=Sphingomonas abietis TaxID=3012344 RepID=A0ABY7NLR1_9SPHN|nr:hypothetical protein [Sphingomonas abietis]WBO21568.1 hypothetical protein PBT88_15485 [Sphingomonas abietis]